MLLKDNYVNQQLADIRFTFEVRKNNTFSLMNTNMCCENNYFTAFDQTCPVV